MTEVPEHLLARSRARRAALGLGGGDDAPPPAAGDAAPVPADAGAATPAAAPSAAPVVDAPPPPPAFVPPYVEAALERKKIPVWAMPVLIFLPVWALLYAQTLSQPPSTEPTQLEAGAEVYSGCQGCHMADGSGGTGRKLNECEVILTFPTIEEQLAFVRGGTASVQGEVYGNPDRPGGPHVGGSFGNMPPFAALSDAELLEVVRHEREVLGGEVVDDARLGPEEELLWPDGQPMLDANGMLVDAEGEPLFADDGTLANPDASEAAGVEPATCE